MHRWRSEWRIVAADRAVFYLVTILLAAGSYGLYTGLEWSRNAQRSIESVQAQVERDIELFTAGVGRFERDHPDAGPDFDPVDPIFRGYAGIPPGTLAIGGYNATLPLSSLEPLAVGQGDLYPVYTKVSLWNNRHDLFSESTNENPIHLSNGRFDLSFVIIYLYPLLILAVTYNLVAGEREQGTLALLASQSVSLRTVISRRSGLLLALVLVPVVLLGCGGVLSGVLTIAKAPLEATDWLRLGMWIAVVAAYTAFWFALALVVNARGFHSAVNATILASAWLLLVLIVPALLNLVVTTVCPVPSRLEYIQALRQSANESEDAANLLLAQYYEAHPEMRPDPSGTGRKTSIYTYWLQKWNTARRMDPVLDRYETAMLRQDQLAARMRFLSPAILAREAMEDLAGTGAGRYREFREATVRFQRDWHAFFAPRMFRGYRMTASDYAKFPRFHMSQENAISVAARAGIPVAGMLLPALLLGLSAYAGINRQSIR